MITIWSEEDREMTSGHRKVDLCLGTLAACRGMLLCSIHSQVLRLTSPSSQHSKHTFLGNQIDQLLCCWWVVFGCLPTLCPQDFSQESLLYHTYTRPVLQLDQMCCRLGFRTLQSWQVSSELYSRHRLLGKGRVSYMNLIGKPGLGHLPHVGLVNRFLPNCLGSLLLLNNCSDLVLLHPDHFCGHSFFPLLPWGFWTNLKSCSPPQTVFCQQSQGWNLFICWERTKHIGKTECDWHERLICVQDMHKLKRGPSVWGRLDARPWCA